jgi:hypothetical protein
MILSKKGKQLFFFFFIHFGFRLLLYHLSESSIPPDSKLKIAKQGVENTISIPVTPFIHSDAIHLLRVLESTDIFRSFNLLQAIEVLSIAKILKFSSGGSALLLSFALIFWLGFELVKEGTLGDRFFILASGIATVQACYFFSYFN